mmetsp:Transcript_46946/g.117041  ORF Transcript_46946/g.117041 Transcript_46946/m.117041 type:complete len:220 (+) Transcript_46946:135-794(+)
MRPARRRARSCCSSTPKLRSCMAACRSGRPCGCISRRTLGAKRATRMGMHPRPHLHPYIHTHTHRTQTQVRPVPLCPRPDRRRRTRPLPQMATCKALRAPSPSSCAAPTSRPFHITSSQIAIVLCRPRYPRSPMHWASGPQARRRRQLLQQRAPPGSSHPQRRATAAPARATTHPSPRDPTHICSRLRQVSRSLRSPHRPLRRSRKALLAHIPSRRCRA